MPASTAPTTRTRRAQANRPKSGRSRADAIVFDSQTTESQATSRSDSTTTSSHKQDSQEDDEDYDPEERDAPLRSQGPTIGEELQELLEDKNAADLEMADHDLRRAEVAARAKQARKAPADPASDHDMADASAAKPGPSASANANGAPVLAGRDLPSDTDDEDYEYHDESGADSSSTSRPAGQATPHEEPEDLRDYEMSEEDDADGADDDQQDGSDIYDDDEGNLETTNPPELPDDADASLGSSQGTGLGSQGLAAEVDYPTKLLAPSNSAIAYPEIRNIAFGTTDRTKDILPPLTISYAIKHGFGYFGPNDLVRLRKDVRSFFLKKGGTYAPTVFTRPVVSGRRGIEVSFRTLEDFHHALNIGMPLWWRNKRTEMEDYGPAIPHNCRLLTFQAPARETDRYIQQELRNQLHPQVRLTHLWAHATAPEGHPDDAVPTGWMVAIVEVTKRNGEPFPGPLSSDAIELIIRWLHLRGVWYEVSFSGRPECCRNCRGTAEDVHQTTNCPYIHCNTCRTRHINGQCPKRRKTNPRASEAAERQAETPTVPPPDTLNAPPSTTTGTSTPTTAAATSAVEVLPGIPIRIAGTASARASASAGPSSRKESAARARTIATHPSLPAKPPAPTGAPSRIPISGPNAEPIGAPAPRPPTTPVIDAPQPPPLRPTAPPKSPKAPVGPRASTAPNIELRDRTPSTTRTQPPPPTPTLISPFPQGRVPNPSHAALGTRLSRTSHLPQSTHPVPLHLLTLGLAIAAGLAISILLNAAFLAHRPPWAIYLEEPSDHAGPPPLRIISYNCGKAGLRGRRAEIFAPHSPFADADVLLLQECGIRSPIDLDDSASLAGILGANFKAHFKGVLGQTAGILFLSLRARPLSSSQGRRWAHARASVRTGGLASAAMMNIDFFSVHGPHRDPNFWTTDFGPAARALTETQHVLPEKRHLIIGADWNALPDPSRDSLYGTPASCPWSAVEPALTPLSLTDVFRYLHPEGRTFTRLACSPSGAFRSARRLDAIWTSRALLRLGMTTTFYPTTSDHWAAGVVIGDNNTDRVPTGPRPRKEWTLHPGTMRSEHFTRAILQACEDIAITRTYPHNATPPQRIAEWVHFSRRLRHIARTEARQVGQTLKAQARQIDALARRIAATDWSTPADVARLPRLIMAHLRAQNLVEDASSMTRQTRAGPAVFRPTSWLSSSALRNGAATVMPPLDPPTAGPDPCEADPQRAIVTAFYKSLYAQPPARPPQHTHADLLLLCAKTRFTPDSVRRLAAPLTLDDLTDALEGANRASSPGPSGLPYPFLDLTWATTGPQLLALALALQDGAALAVQLHTTLLHKKGPKSDLANYRPISVSDAALRIICRALAKRLQAASADALPWFQAAFMPGRRTSTLAAVLQGIIDDVLSLRPGAPPSTFVIFLDQQKAYDRVDRDWLWRVLSAAGLPSTFLNALKGLYSNPTARVMVNGSLTSPIPLLAGLLQGDPLSCSLYNLALQPLLDLITSAGVGVDVPGLGRVACLAFADDVVLLIPGGPEGLAQWSQVETALAAYEAASNARLNRAKCGFVEIRPHGIHCPDDDNIRDALLGAGFRPLPRENGEVIHLGHPIQTLPAITGTPLSFGRRLEALGKRSQQVDVGATDLLVRARLTKSLLTPKLWHHTSVGGLTPEADRLLWSATNRFLYLGDRPWVDKSVASAPTHLGGLGLIAPDRMFTAQSIAFLARHLTASDDYGTWLQRGIAYYLHARHGTSPAIFLLPDSNTRKRLALPAVRADGLWGRLTHALASMPLRLEPTWYNLDTRALLTLPWALDYPDKPPPGWPTVKQVATRADRGWLTWGDILWRGVSRAHGQSWTDSWPLGPPGSKASAAHHQPRPGRPRDVTGPGLGQSFGTLWRALPMSVRSSLKAAADLPFTVPTQPDLSVPLPADPECPHFPWSLLSLGDRPLSDATTQRARRLLDPTDPCVPSWTLEPPPPAAHWREVWVELNTSPLRTRARADVLLWLHRRTWLCLGADGAEPCPHPECTARESQEHVIVDCPGAQAVWQACLPILAALGCPTDLPFDLPGLVLAWPTRRRHRRRLVAWRSTVVAAIVAARRPALARARAGAPYRLTLDPAKIRNKVATSMADGILSLWRQLRTADGDLAHRQSSFSKKWFDGGHFGGFLSRTDDTPTFFPLAVTTPPAAPPSLPPLTTSGRT